MGHILVTNELFDDFTNEGSAISTIKIDEYLVDGWHEQGEKISDHRPVALRLSINSNTGFTDIISLTYHLTTYPNPFDSKTTIFIKPLNDSNLKVKFTSFWVCPTYTETSYFMKLMFLEIINF